MAGNNSIPDYFHIKRKALNEWIELSEAIDDNQFYPCNENPYYYTDYPENHKVPLTVDKVEALCEGCPILKQCYNFAVKNEEQHGIWGGVSFYKNLTIEDN